MEAVAIQPSGVLHLKVHLFQRGRYALRSRPNLCLNVCASIRFVSLFTIVTYQGLFQCKHKLDVQYEYVVHPNL